MSFQDIEPGKVLDKDRLNLESPRANFVGDPRLRKIARLLE